MLDDRAGAAMMATSVAAVKHREDHGGVVHAGDGKSQHDGADRWRMRVRRR